MKNNSKAHIFTVLFVLTAVLDVIAVAFQFPVMEAVVKPMIMLMLMGIYLFSAEKKNNWYLLALAFSFLGDVLLLDKESSFLFGIAAFLLAQLIYIKLIAAQIKSSTTKQKILAVTPFIIYIAFLMLLLKDDLGDFLIPVVVYGIAIGIFGVMALLNYLTFKDTLSLILLFGAVIFIASDSMIALNKFYQPNPIYPVAIMITYITAQYLIYRFMVRRI